MSKNASYYIIAYGHITFKHVQSSKFSNVELGQYLVGEHVGILVYAWMCELCNELGITQLTAGNCDSSLAYYIHLLENILGKDMHQPLLPQTMG